MRTLYRKAIIFMLLGATLPASAMRNTLGLLMQPKEAPFPIFQNSLMMSSSKALYASSLPLFTQRNSVLLSSPSTYSQPYKENPQLKFDPTSTRNFMKILGGFTLATGIVISQKKAPVEETPAQENKEKQPLPPTLIHLQRNLKTENYNNVSSTFEHDYSLHDPLVKNMVNALVAKERELAPDYYTFVHAQPNSCLPNEQLNTLLQRTLQQEPVNNEHFLLNMRNSPTTPHEIEQEKKLQETLIAEGARFVRKGKSFVRSNLDHVLFANWAYFANLAYHDSSTASFIARNICVNNKNLRSLTAQEVFSLNNLDHLYPKYRSKLEDLQQEFQSLTHYGTCILLAVPKKTINKHVYLAADGGLERTITLQGKGETKDLALIMDTLNNNPEKIADSDKTEFCIPMTYDENGALNPKSGIKTFAFNAADQEKLATYYAHQNELFAQIKKDIEKSLKNKVAWVSFL